MRFHFMLRSKNVFNNMVVVNMVLQITQEEPDVPEIFTLLPRSAGRKSAE